jgi:hypothetical protein
MWPREPLFRNAAPVKPKELYRFPTKLDRLHMKVHMCLNRSNFHLGFQQDFLFSASTARTHQLAKLAPLSDFVKASFSIFGSREHPDDSIATYVL